MAQILPNPMFDGFRKRLGNIVLVRCGDETFMRKFTPPRNPRTDAQQARRGLFADAVRSWQAMGDDEKARWNKLAREKRRKTVHGYHLFISAVLDGRAASTITGTVSFMKKDSSYAPFMKLRSSSVAAPSQPSCTVYDPIIMLPETVPDPGGG